MENISEVDRAYRNALATLKRRGLPLINAQASVGRFGTIVFLDIAGERDVASAVTHIADTCSIRFVAVAEEAGERSLFFVGALLVEVRFGLELAEVSGRPVRDACWIVRSPPWSELCGDYSGRGCQWSRGGDRSSRGWDEAGVGVGAAPGGGVKRHEFF